MGQLDFSTFEHQGWERVGQPYHTYFGDLTSQSNDAMLEALGIYRGVRLLDVASGPGYLAAAAARHGGDAAGVDFSAAMVAKAGGVFPAIEFRVGDAENLPFPDKSLGAAGTHPRGYRSSMSDSQERHFQRRTAVPNASLPGAGRNSKKWRQLVMQLMH